MSLFASAAAQQFVMYTPGGDDTAVERADPIIAPGQVSGHVHQIFGSGAFQPELHYDELLKGDCTTVGDASGNGNAEDHSVYWHPALYAEKSDGNGYVKIPTNGHKLYYKDVGSGNDQKAEPFEFPHGFRMIAGDPFQRAAADDVQRQNITQWVCHDSSGWNQGTDGGFPNGVADCDSVSGFNAAIHFPHCWNGQDFDASNPNAHMSYPTGDVQAGDCPSSHPTRLPHIFMENTFNLHSVAGQIKADSYVLAMGDETGYGFHADFFNGWEDGAIPDLLTSCPEEYYGNADAGLCSSFKKTSTPSGDCKLKTTFDEKVEDPGNALPGCNPITNTNPAPKLAIAAVGVISTTCDVLSGVVDTVGDAVGGLLGGGNNNNNDQTTQATQQATTLMTATATRSAASEPTMTLAVNNKAVSSDSGDDTLSCPDSNGSTFTSNNRDYEIECGTDHPGGDYNRVFKTTFQSCVEECAQAEQCVAVSMSGSACYLKSELRRSRSNRAIAGAKLVSGGNEKREFEHSHARRHLHSHAHAHGRHF